MESCADFEQAPYASIKLNPPRRRLSDTRQDLEHCGLTGSIPADNSDNFTRVYSEVNPSQRPDCILGTSRPGPQSVQRRTQCAHNGVTQSGIGSVERAYLILLAHIFNGYYWSHSEARQYPRTF